jgi:hypothetical protein
VVEGIPERDGGRENELMGYESKYHGTEANIYSMDWRAGHASSGCRGLASGRSVKTEASIGSKSRLVSLISECFQKTENGHES